MTANITRRQFPISLHFSDITAFMCLPFLNHKLKLSYFLEKVAEPVAYIVNEEFSTNANFASFPRP